MSTGLYSGVSGLALGTGLYKNVSGLWGGASGLDAGFGGGSPFGGASLYLDFLAGAPLDPRITFSRGSNATLVDSTGKITYAPANLLTRSEEFDNAAAWTPAGATISANQTLAPDGATTADKIAETATTNNHAVFRSTIGTAGVTYTLSFFLKAAERDFARVGVTDGGVDYAVRVNLLTGAITLTDAGITGTVTNAGNGWYRLAVTRTVANGTFNVFAGANQNATGTSAYAGTAGSGIFIWGAQLEPVTYQTTPSTYVATTTAAYYGPRFDYDPVTLAAKGLLIEEQRTNLLTYSQGIGGTNWLPDDITATFNSIAAPDGTLTASTLTDTATNSDHRVISSGTNPSFTVGASYTLSVYVKNNTRNFIQVVFGTGAFSATAYANFDVATGVLGTVGAGTTASITAVGSGWYRCTVTATATVTASTPIFFGLITSATAVRAELYAGTGSSLYVWGAQLEAASFATSYIPTVASTVTRSADNASMTGTNFSSWFNATQGTLISTFSSFATGSGSRIVAELNDGTSNNRYTQVHTPTGSDRFLTFSGGSAVVTTLDYTAVGVNVVGRWAAAYAVGNYGASLNGATALTSNYGFLVSGINTLAIGNTGGSTLLNGHIQSIAYYNTRLTNTELQTLTAPSLGPTLTMSFTNQAYTVGV